jgi:hypothetical protein
VITKLIYIEISHFVFANTAALCPNVGKINNKKTEFIGQKKRRAREENDCYLCFLVSVSKSWLLLKWSCCTYRFEQVKKKRDGTGKRILASQLSTKPRRIGLGYLG